MFNQKGSAAIMAVGVMLILGLFAVAVLPMVTNEVKLSKLNSDAIEAQFAAEAGAKRAISAFYRQATDWNWLNTAQSLVKNVSNKQYTVSIINKATQQPIGTTGYPPAGTYVIKSTGTVNGASRTVTVEVTVSGGGGKLNDGQGANSLIFDKAIFAGDKPPLDQYDAISIEQHANIIGSIAANGKISGEKHSNISGNIIEYANIYPLPSFYTGGKFDQVLYSNGAKFPSSSWGEYKLNQQLYYVNGSLVISQNSLLDVTNANGTTIIYVNGSVVIDQNVSIADGDNILLIATGSVSVNQNLNKHTTPYGNLVIVAGGAVSIAQNTNIRGGVYANGPVSIAQNADIAYSQDVINAFTLPGSGSGGVSVVWQ